MPRQARKKSKSGIYHIMLRGIDRQRIFRDAEDHVRFLNIVQNCRAQCGFLLHAYCLMGNHVHLLIQVREDNLETVFKKIGCRYVFYFNVKYQRTGHLFQDRFKSEPVDDDGYFLTVLRYIHQNPVKAGLCDHPEDYPFSSYAQYLGESTLADTELALGMMDRGEFAAFHSAPNSDVCLELAEPARRAISDAKAQELIRRISHCESAEEFQSLENAQKERFTRSIHSKGVSVRQLARLTGMSKGQVEKYLRAKEKKTENRPLS